MERDRSIGIIAVIILLSNLLRRKIPFVRNSLMPTAVLGGFLLLVARTTGFLSLDTEFMEILIYHGIALGFIAMSLRIPDKTAAAKASLTGPKTGAIIVGSYLIQAIVGLIISIGLAYTLMRGCSRRRASSCRWATDRDRTGQQRRHDL
jgi:ESS family glutamate:Na+ symporter